MSRYYGFTVEQIKQMTMYQFGEYMQNMNLYEKLSMGNEAEQEQEVYTETELIEIAQNHGIEIPKEGNK